MGRAWVNVTAWAAAVSCMPLITHSLTLCRSWWSTVQTSTFRAMVCLPIVHTQPCARAFNGPFSGTTRVSRYRNCKTNLDFAEEARDSEWQWHQVCHMQVCTSLQADNHASTPTTQFFLQDGCPSCRPANSIKALKAIVKWKQSNHRFVQCSVLSWATDL